MPDIQQVTGADSPNTGRTKWNGNDTELEHRIDAHKFSGDHDGRYYTESEVNTLLTAHVAGGDHDGRYYTKAEIATLVAAGSARPFPIPFSFSDTGEMATFGNRESSPTTGIPVPPGTIKIMIAGGAGNMNISTLSITTIANAIVSVDLSALGANEYLCMLVVNGESTAVTVGLTTRPLFGTILFETT
jgi:hypothetical protein